MRFWFLILFWVFVFYPAAFFAQITFERLYGGSGYEVGGTSQQTSDGGYIVVGTTDSFGDINNDIYLIKTDIRGDTLWTHIYGGDDRDSASDVRQTNDGGYVIVGVTWSYGAGVNDIYVIKTDAGGDTLWTKTYGGRKNESGASIQQTPDGGYVVLGFTNSFGAGGIDVFLIKTDVNGDTLWTRTFGGRDIDNGQSVRLTTDGGYVIAGFTKSVGSGEYDIYLIKADADGNMLWTQTYGGQERESGSSVCQTTDGGYIIAGYTKSFGAGASDVYLIKTNANGDTLWTGVYGGIEEDSGFSVLQTVDGGYIIAGGTESFGAGSSDAYLLKTDKNGDLLWTRTFGASSWDLGRSIESTLDGGYIVSGSTESFGASQGDIYLIKTDSSGKVTGASPDTLEFVSSNLPIVVIDTQGEAIVDARRIAADMGIIQNGENKRNHVADPKNHYNGQITIELRGSSSQWYPKKQYRFETIDTSGNDYNVSLLGLPRENDWILYGPYSDQSLIRNVLAYRLSLEMGRYASRTRFCELIVNGNYKGLYILMEKIKRDNERVNLARTDSTHTAGDSLTGGYIIKIDKIAGENVGGWNSNLGIEYQYHYPKANQIVPKQQDYIKNFMDEFEEIMAGDFFSHPDSGYSQIIDVASFVDHFILNEFCKNVDAYRLSAFMYKDSDSNGGKLFMGPIWDFNLSMGKAWFSEDGAVVEGWQVDYSKRRPDDLYTVPFYWEKLSHDPNFVQKVETRWNELKVDLLRKENLYGMIDLLVDTLSEARVRNFQRWPECEIDHVYDVEIENLKQWIGDRIDWMDDNISELTSVSEQSKRSANPPKVTLEHNYPNPFNPETTIQYTITVSAYVKLSVFDLLGHQIETLVSETQQPGNYRVNWKPGDLASGVYVYKLEVFDYSKSSGPGSVDLKKMLYIK